MITKLYLQQQFQFLNDIILQNERFYGAICNITHKKLKPLLQDKLLVVKFFIKYLCDLY